MPTKLTEPHPTLSFPSESNGFNGGNSRNAVLAAELIKSMSTAADNYLVNGMNSKIFTAHLYES